VEHTLEAVYLSFTNLQELVQNCCSILSASFQTGTVLKLGLKVADAQKLEEKRFINLRTKALLQVFEVKE